LKCQLAVVESFQFSWGVSVVVECIHEVGIVLSDGWDRPRCFKVNCALGAVKEVANIGDPPVSHPWKRCGEFKDGLGYSRIHLMGLECKVDGCS